MKTWQIIVLAALTVGGVIYGVVLLNRHEAAEAERYNAEQKAREEEEWGGRCRDQSELLATTFFSGNSYVCPHKRHRMRVEPVTKAGEEIGALVFCQCQRDGDAGQ